MERRGIEVVLQVRRATRDQIAARLACHLRREREAVAGCAACALAVDSAAHDARRATESPGRTPQSLARHHAHVRELERARVAAEQLLTRVRDELAQIRAEWVAAQREVEGLEEICARRATARSLAANRREQAEADEWGARPAA